MSTVVFKQLDVILTGFVFVCWDYIQLLELSLYMTCVNTCKHT
jgi:hypothetical protein